MRDGDVVAPEVSGPKVVLLRSSAGFMTPAHFVAAICAHVISSVRTLSGIVCSCVRSVVAMCDNHRMAQWYLATQTRSVFEQYSSKP